MSVRNLAGFVADSYLSTAALRPLYKSHVPGEAEIERRYKEFRRLWQRTIDRSRVNETSGKQRTLDELHLPVLKLLGFDQPLHRRELDLDPERAVLLAFDDREPPPLLVDALPFALDADARLERGEFRGSAQRRMERALAVSGTRFGLIMGGTRWRLVQLDTAAEPRYIEFDLDAMIETEDIAAFGLLATICSPAFLLADPPLLADLVEKSDALGTEVSDKLGPAARHALELFLEGVRSDERNAAWVPACFAEGEPLRAIHREGIYVLYRLLFVLYAEAHGALPIDKPLYLESYSLERLRLALSTDHEEFAENAYGLWDSVKALFRLIDRGARTKEFHIPSYNGGLFASDRAPALDKAHVSDRVFARMLHELTTVEIKRGKQKTRDRVSFRELGVSQLGAVFEGLLDYEPHIASENLYEIATGTGKQKAISYLPASALGHGVILSEARKASVVEGQFYLRAWGGQRKSTGAYYTPKVIADYLVREALGPQVEGKSSAEILEIAVCDPAMGSGGFLVSATEFLGEAYYNARIREGFCDPDDDHADRHRIEAKRTVAERCVYGVDVNPMAVELAKVSLWLATLSYDRPLSFFDHHLRCGNSLLGAPLRDDDGNLTSSRIQSIPKAALQSVDSEASKEEKEALKAIARRNDAELKAIERRGGEKHAISMFALDLKGPLDEYAKARKQLSADDSTQSAEEAVERIRSKERQLRDLTQDPTSPFFRLKEICDVWMSPWFWPYDSKSAPPTTDEYQALLRDIWETGEARSDRGRTLLTESNEIAREHRFFHWELEFPEVFERSGFHAIVGNPPWETLSPKTQEFFSNYDPRFREYGKQEAVSVMKRLRADPEVQIAYRRYARFSYQLASFLKDSGVYAWYATGNLAKGDFDLFRAFVERDFRALLVNGRLAQVLKDSIYINSNCSEIRRHLLTDGSIRRFVVNENRRLVFPIHASIKIVLLIAERGLPDEVVSAGFFLGKDDDGNERSLSVRELETVLVGPGAHLIEIPIKLIRQISPDTLAFIEIRDAADVALLEHLSRVGIPFGEAWEPQYCCELHMTNDSHLFVEREQLERIGAIFDGMRWHHPTEGEFWPLVEGKNIYQYEFPVGTFRYWVNAKHSTALPSANGKPVNHYPRLAWRNVASSTNERSIIAEIIPEGCFLGHSLQSVAGGALEKPTLLGTLTLFNSFLFDWQARLRGGTNLTHSTINTIFVACRLREFHSIASIGAEREAKVFHDFRLPFELGEHMMRGFPLLDRLQPALDGELRSTITRDLVLACYAEMLNHPKAAFYRERATAATGLGAKPFIPATRAVTSSQIVSAPEDELESA